MKGIRDELKKVILKKAKGYATSETVEEYQGEEGGMVLTKKKVTKKHVPPDTQAVKILMELDESEDITTLSDSDLEKEKIRLLKLLKEIENESNEN